MKLILLIIGYAISTTNAGDFCPPITAPEFARLTGSCSQATVHQTCVFTCFPEFVLKGPRVLYCDHGGEWSSEPPTCMIRRCRKEGTFLCDDAWKCIDRSFWCNGISDCRDRSDEKYCEPNSNCTRLHFTCADGSCIPLTGKCDGMYSCPDLSDESGCSTTSDATADLDNTVDSSPNTTAEQKIRKDSKITSSKRSQAHLSSSNDQIPTPSNASTYRITDSFHPWLDKRVSRILSEIEGHELREDIPRAVISLYLSNPDFFKDNSPTKTRIIKKLHFKLLIELFRNKLETMSLSTLSHFINALAATYSDPRNFYRLDLLNILREKTNAARNRGFVNPFVYLTLCIAGESNQKDLEDIKALILTNRTDLRKPELLSYATLGALCMTDDTEKRHHYARLGLESLSHSSEFSFSSSIFMSAFLVRLSDLELNYTNEFQNYKQLAVEFILQDQVSCSGSGLLNFYAMPLLSGNSLDSLKKSYDAISRGEMFKDESAANVTLSLFIGDAIDVSYTMQLNVPPGTTLFEGLKLAQDIDPAFGCKFEMSMGYPTVLSVGGRYNDAEEGKYWLLYISTGSLDPKDLIFTTIDITKIILDHKDHYALWYKSLQV